VEVHQRPDEALSDGPQSLYPGQFEKLMRDIEAMAPVMEKELLRTPRASAPRKYAAVGAQAASGAPSQSAAPAAGASQMEEKVVFCGEAGAYAEQAIMRAFGEDVPRLSVDSFTGVFDAVLEGKASAGVVPVENSQTGSIHENYDLFLRYPDVAIVGELKIRIVHCLIADTRADMETIKIVRSHPQGFLQCKEFLDKHPGWTLEPVTTTSSAVSSIAKDGAVKVAAIAGEAAAKVYGLKVLCEGIETNPLNYTRFLIIARRTGDKTPVPPSLGGAAANKASLVFSVSDEPGSLFSCLRIMSEKGLNLSKLESRPIPGKPWEYLFYVDVGIDAEDTFSSTMEELKTKTKDFYFLGSYRASL
jgi:3-deoxy-7-phosphoheptulonate synthase